MISKSLSLENKILIAFKKGADDIFNNEIERAKKILETRLKMYYVECAVTLSQWMEIRNNENNISINVKFPKE